MVKQEYTKPEEYIKSLLEPNGYCDLGRFTIINNALRDENELGEIVVATGAQQVADIITFTPERIALLYTMAIIQTEIKINDEQHLNKIVDNMYHNLVLPKVKLFLDQDLSDIKTSIDKEVGNSMRRLQTHTLDQNNHTDRLIQDTLNIIQTRINDNLYTPGKYYQGENINSIVEKIVKDKIFNKVVGSQIEKIAEKSINEVLEQQNTLSTNSAQIPLERLSLHEGSKRITFMIAGPPACGKGSITSMMELEAKESGIAFNDIVKINTDFYRTIVSTGQKLGPNIVSHADLNNDESAMITDLTIKRLQAKINNGKAPNVLLDTVSIKQTKIDFGTADNGQMKIKIMTLRPEIALERAQKRGERSGRFVPTKYMLEAHKKLGESITTILKNNIGKALELEIYDNDVADGELPALVQSTHVKGGKVKVYDIDKYGKIYGRKFINTNAYNASYIYPKNPQEDFSQLKILKEAGYRLVVPDDVSASKYLSTLNPEKAITNGYDDNHDHLQPSASYMAQNFEYVSRSMSEIKALTEGLENQFNAGSDTKSQDQAWFTPETVTKAFDIVSIIRTQVRLTKVLVTLGSQLIDHGKRMVENIQSDQIKKEDFIDELKLLSTQLKEDVSKLDNLSSSLKKANITEPKIYRDKIIDLSSIALELQNTLKEFKHEESIPEIRLKELEEKTKLYTKQVKNLQKDLKQLNKQAKLNPTKAKDLSPETPVFTSNQDLLKELTKQYKKMSKETETLIKNAKSEVETKGNNSHKPIKHNNKGRSTTQTHRS